MRAGAPICCIGMLLGLLAAVTWAGCSPEGDKNPQPTQSDSVIRLTDARGETIQLAEPPRRVVSLAPSCTEIIMALGGGDKLAGRTRFCTYPPEVAQVPAIGGMQDPDWERLVELQPQLVLVSDLTDAGTYRRLKEVGINVLWVSRTGLAGLLEDIRMVGRALGREEAAEKLVAGIEEERRLASKTLSGVEPDARPLVLLTIGELETYSAGSGSYISDLINEVGARNLADEAQSQWPRLSLERIIIAQPDLILVASHAVEAPGRPAPELLQRYRQTPGWRDLEAVKRGNLLLLPAEVLTVPGPRVQLALEWLREAVSPWTASQSGNASVPARSPRG